jgi:hydroxyethylthiazole kinase-like uncharacterized protein yjeF
VVTPTLLRSLPLPDHGGESSKHERGAVLVVGGSRQMPGAVLLAGTAALRMGAGSLAVATAATASPSLAMALPEARAVGLPERADDEGSVDAGAGVVARLRSRVERADAVLIGSGMASDPELGALVDDVAAANPHAVVVLDAGALVALSSGAVRAAADRVVALPNPAEMATLLEVGIDEVLSDLPGALASAMDRFGTVLALRGSETWIADPSGDTYVERGGHPSLATSGSGDVLAGAVAGLAARGATPLAAAVWAVHGHAVAGERLAARGLGLGALARELLDELPLAMRALQT